MDLIADLLLGLALMVATFGTAGLILGVAAMAMAAIGEALIARGWTGGLVVRVSMSNENCTLLGGDPPRARIKEIVVGRGV